MWPFIVLLLQSTAPCSAELAALSAYEVQHATGAITVDGKLDEPDWATAPSVEFVFPWEDQTGAKQNTTAKLLWDETNLYGAYKCEDADLTAECTQRDDPTYQDDCVELFLNPNPARSQMYYGMEMNCRGVLYDYFQAFPVTLLKQVNFAGVHLKTQLRGTLNKRDDKDDGWTLEVAVPFANFAELQRDVPPKPGASWRLNLNRWDGLGDRRLSQWSNSGMPTPNPHNPERFGVVTFIDQRHK
ncbi:MAG: hypothetical protein COZ06_18590 [Armatimonadetes bacterium CG_4_10_14_3_um_filter_66_18]|nr:hypothetical protein [Armatimonadota bacterium]OIO93205.1 MAG: hypothetical protein AUJ96_30780 [Armatimonadetes bacterium CG2_30_66_41]PIU89601.1 MAG: hypothetical protein COS65_28315 [Armatimonadetes bacterium CG06_land_8_20_14_3_00_66_21]PIW13192.1 MAG: hypothetical protein COW34_10950 [Armatimonadetes bacterium CG17_big_fil_post_rev_8_21_14_2_50_66_6]PIX49833.1 MAG: hypothetical protein COZ57_02020 [Armatimonadetes bacterium CG_4_8_14_3_um_filter_66_20]PIY46294.1 MAG: hypothetical prote